MRNLVIFPVLFLIGCASAKQEPQVRSGLQQLRAATRPFQNLDSAVAVGYVRDVKDCFVHEHHGAMGYHHVNRAFADAKVDVAHPEILLYERMPDGKYRLNGVEFIVPYRAYSRDSAPPTVMGQLMKHEDHLNIWYLHVWAWRDNPLGVFSDFHPDVKCPPNEGKVFIPFNASAPAQRSTE